KRASKPAALERSVRISDKKGSATRSSHPSWSESSFGDLFIATLQQFIGANMGGFYPDQMFGGGNFDRTQQRFGRFTRVVGAVTADQVVVNNGRGQTVFCNGERESFADRSGPQYDHVEFLCRGSCLSGDARYTYWLGGLYTGGHHCLANGLSNTFLRGSIAAENRLQSAVVCSIDSGGTSGPQELTQCQMADLRVL